MLRIKHINALNRFALRYGYGWRRRLLEALIAGKDMPGRTSERDKLLLHELHALAGCMLIDTFRPLEAGFTQIAYLRKDHVEKCNTQRSWYVNAWRLVDHKGADLVQPWAHTKTEARAMAQTSDIYLIEQ